MSIQLFLQLTVSFVIGCAVSLAYFGGLWFTVRRIRLTRNSLLYLAVSAAIRLGFILAAIVIAILAGADARHLLAALAGFLVIRQWLISRARRSGAILPDHPQI